MPLIRCAERRRDTDHDALDVVALLMVGVTDQGFDEAVLADRALVLAHDDKGEVLRLGLVSMIERDERLTIADILATDWRRVDLDIGMGPEPRLDITTEEMGRGAVVIAADHHRAHTETTGQVLDDIGDQLRGHVEHL